MLLSILYPILVFISLVSGIGSIDKPASSCQPKRLEGFWYYAGAPESTILMEKDQAGEHLGEIGVMIHYTIKWKQGCDHDFIVKAVYTDVGKITPAPLKSHLFKVGEVIGYHMTGVYKDSLRYDITYRGKITRDQMVYRVPEKLYRKKK